MAFMEYPDKSRVIRSSMRCGLLGVLCLCLPPVSWTCCRAARRELDHAVRLSGDPLVMERSGGRHLGLGMIAALIGLMFGVWVGLIFVGLFILAESVVVLRRFFASRPRRFNPARIHLYFGAIFTSTAQMQAAFILLGLLLYPLLRGFNR